MCCYKFHSSLEETWAAAGLRASRAMNSCIQDMGYIFCIPCVKPHLNNTSEAFYKG